MKIWVIGRNYPDQSNNGQGSFELEQAKMLAKRGNDVTYIACVLHPFWRIKNGGFVEFDDAPVRVIAYSGFFTPHMTDPMIQFPYFPRLRNRKWEKLLRKAEESVGLPDVIHLHYPLMVLSHEAFMRYKERGVELVVTEHWSKVQNQHLDKYEIYQMKTYLNIADTYMAVGYKLRRSIIETSGTTREVEILPNIVNDLFRPAQRSHDGYKFGVVGRLSPEKQVDKIISAFAKNFINQTGISLVIVGDGKERRKLEKMANILKVENQIEFNGIKSRSETAEIMKNLDCLICYSRYETFGVSVIEAWACGVPVITTTADSVSEQWDEKMGISIGSNCSSELEKAMLQMIELKYDRYYISEYAIRNYSEDNVYAKLMNIYEKNR